MYNPRITSLTSFTGTNRFGEEMTVKVGDTVGFKSDIEQGGLIIRIERHAYRTVLILQNEYGFEGEYIGGETETGIDFSDCWAE